MKSRDNSVISQPNQVIVDAYGTIWSIIGDQAAADGIVDASTNRVTQLAYANGEIWQKNTDNLWWSKNTYSNTWDPPGGTSASPLAQSKNNTVITLPEQFIVDASGRTWTIVGGQVATDGVIDAATNRVTELAYENGRVWQENTGRLWWSKNTATNTWEPPGGTPNSPVHSVARTWFGGDGAFAAAADWSGGAIPQAGDTAVISRGTVMMGSSDGTGVNFSFQGVPGQATPTQAPTLKFNSSGSNSIGMVQGSANGEIRLDGTPSVTMAGIQASGSQLLILSYQGRAVTVAGDSSLTNGASLTVQGFTGGEVPLAHFENDGIMSVDASSASLGDLSGQGIVRVTHGGSLAVAGATAGETIQLQSGHLDILAGRYRPAFLAPITDFGANSSINIRSAQVTPGTDVREVFAMSGPTSGELLIYKGTRVAVDLRISGQSHIYASYGSAGGGEIVLTANDTGHSIPIATS